MFEDIISLDEKSKDLLPFNEVIELEGNIKFGSEN
jgi:hypothetical protein